MTGTSATDIGGVSVRGAEMLVTRREIAAVKAQKLRPDSAYIRNFSEDQLKRARELLDEGYAHKQLDQIFGLSPGQKVAWALKRWSEGQPVKPDPAICNYDIDINRAGPPRGGTRRKRTW